MLSLPPTRDTMKTILTLIACLLLTSCRWPGVDQHEHDRVTQPQTTNSPTK